MKSSVNTVRLLQSMIIGPIQDSNLCMYILNRRQRVTSAYSIYRMTFSICDDATFSVPMHICTWSGPDHFRRNSSIRGCESRKWEHGLFPRQMLPAWLSCALHMCIGPKYVDSDLLKEVDFRPSYSHQTFTPQMCLAIRYAGFKLGSWESLAITVLLFYSTMQKAYRSLRKLIIKCARLHTVHTVCTHYNLWYSR